MHVGQTLVKRKQEEYKNTSVRNDKRRDEKFMSVEKHPETEGFEIERNQS